MHKDGTVTSAEIWWLGLSRKWWVLAAVGVGTFMSALNGAIVNTVIPLIMGSYGIDLAMAEWVVMVYLLIVSGLLLTFGRLGDMVGHKRVYLQGFVVFTIASVLCGLAPTSEVLLVVRVVQAVGAAMLFSTSPAILIDNFPGRQRGQALGMQGTMTYLGLMVGPALGGYLAGNYGWQAVFLINLPLGLLAIVLSYASIPSKAGSARGERFDLAGAFAFMAGLSALLLAMSHGQSWGWTSGIVFGLLAAGAVLLCSFVYLEMRTAFPMLDLSLFLNRLFSAATVSSIINYVCTYGVTFLVPFYLIQYRGFSPAHSGLLLSTQALAMAVVAPFSGTLSDRIGSWIPSSLGMAITTVGLVLLSSVGPNAPDVEIAGYLGLIGLGIGIFVSPNSSALMGSVPPQRRGVASAVMAEARNVGMVLGVALAGAVFATALASNGGAIQPGDSGFLPAFRVAFLVLAACGAVGVVTSMVRGRSPAQMEMAGSGQLSPSSRLH